MGCAASVDTVKEKKTKSHRPHPYAADDTRSCGTTVRGGAAVPTDIAVGIGHREDDGAVRPDEGGADGADGEEEEEATEVGLDEETEDAERALHENAVTRLYMSLVRCGGVEPSLAAMAPTVDARTHRAVSAWVRSTLPRSVARPPGTSSVCAAVSTASSSSSYFAPGAAPGGRNVPPRLTEFLLLDHADALWGEDP